MLALENEAPKSVLAVSKILASSEVRRKRLGALGLGASTQTGHAQECSLGILVGKPLYFVS